MSPDSLLLTGFKHLGTELQFRFLEIGLARAIIISSCLLFVNLKDEATTLDELNSINAGLILSLRDLLLLNAIQRKTLFGLIQLYVLAAATDTDLSSEVHFLKHNCYSVENLKKDIEKQKKADAKLEVLISRLKKNRPDEIVVLYRRKIRVSRVRLATQKQMGGSEISRSEEKSFENNDVFVWISKKIQEPLKAEFKKLRSVKEQQSMIKPVLEIETTHDEEREEEKLEKQLQAWRDNPSWIDQPPNVQVKSQNGLFCHLNAEFNVGLPPKSVYKIFTHPDNKRYFKNIKECISRKVLMEDGPMQTVEVKQAAAWKFLWWAGTFPIHLIVQENRKHLMSNYKQEKTMFMKVFEGCWRVEPLFIDEHLCERLKPKTQEDYDRCTNGRGRIGSKVKMDQMFQPSAILTPPPLSWYIRGITTKTTESMIEDLLAEAARIRGGGRDDDQVINSNELDKRKVEDIKERWRSRRRCNGRRLTNRRKI
ncbi:unnamed protein product [Brassica oleracea]